jgi:transposase-like protein
MSAFFSPSSFERARSLAAPLTGSAPIRAIPKLRQGSCFPPILERRNTSEKALIAVLQEAWIAGVSTRKVDDLVQATIAIAPVHHSDPSRVS